MAWQDKTFCGAADLMEQFCFLTTPYPQSRRPFTRRRGPTAARKMRHEQFPRLARPEMNQDLDEQTSAGMRSEGRCSLRDIRSVSAFQKAGEGELVYLPVMMEAVP